MKGWEAFKGLVWEVFPLDLEVKREVRREAKVASLLGEDDIAHLNATGEWLVRAHSASHDGGVSRAYNTRRRLGSKYRGWQPSYPETTGYIIPTMFALCDFFNSSEFGERAMRMANWEIDVQLTSGAVMGSVVTSPASPAVFNTGQVIFGFLEAFRRSKEQKYLEAALRAGDYLVSVQEPSGSWVKGNSRYALDRATTYNTRVAWALIELGFETGKDKYKDAGRRNIEYALKKQRKNGWFSDNCLSDPEKPLLHTVMYATRGLLESGISLNEESYVDAALTTLEALVNCQRVDGGISGRLSADWSPAANWDCLTGDAQAAVAWLRAYAIKGDEKYRDSARRAIEFVKRTQNLRHPNPGIRGGVKGSFPFDGPYGQYQMLNWAAKFFCDAILLANSQSLRERGIHG